jgi:hypothetical protein
VGRFCQLSERFCQLVDSWWVGPLLTGIVRVRLEHLLRGLLLAGPEETQVRVVGHAAGR